MSGKLLTTEQVELYMSNLKKPKHTQKSAAASAGFSTRMASRIDSGTHQLKKLNRNYKTRKDPFDGLFETHLIPLLKAEPQLQPITLLEALDEFAPGKFDDSHLRTLQRRVKHWRANEGPDQEVIFQQKHIAGDMGISDYTWANELKITIDGESFEHKLYHYRLVYSGWTYVQVILGGESFESLSSGLQNALWRSGGVPKTHRTDSLSAAFNNHYEKETLTERYSKLCKHYGIKATRNNKGVAHENGAIESPNRHLKHKMEQKLLLRGSRDFISLSEYEHFINEIVLKINRRCKTRYQEECLHLEPLPKQRTNDFSEQQVKVTSRSTISIKRAIYSVPSRLINSKLLVRIYDDRLDLFHGCKLTCTLKRVYSQGKIRAHSINYKHIINSLIKKPNAFSSCVYRDEIVPEGDFTIIWNKLKEKDFSDKNCHYIVDLMAIAYNYDCEEPLGRFALNGLEKNKPVSIQECRKLFATIKTSIPNISSHQHELSSYNLLIGGSYAQH